MFKHKISIKIAKSNPRDLIYDEFLALLGNLRRTGQIPGNSDLPFFDGDELVSFQTAPEKNSLSKKYFDQYTTQSIREIETKCGAKLKTETIGNAIPGTAKACKCRNPGFYILFTHFINEPGCIECGNCAGIVPLYKLTTLNHEDRMQIHRWEGSYKACDELQIASSFGEKWATKQMSDPASGLSEEGLTVCKMLSKKTGIETYYYLFAYKTRSFKNDMERKCPVCNSKWILNSLLHDFYSFKCDRCKLVSNFSVSMK